MQAEYRREQIGALIAERLEQQKEALASRFQSQRVPYFVVDALLPQELVTEIFARFPEASQMMLRSSLRERKYVTSQMDDCQPLMEEIVFAFQQKAVVEVVGEITGIRGLEADPQLYAGGLSLMRGGHFLNPHIDNSHDKGRERYRVLNLLFYVTPGFGVNTDGDLELWPDGPTGAPVAIASLCNRLVVMMTGTRSWHSVSPVQGAYVRRCVSNYYFSAQSPEHAEYFHVTSFRGRPAQRLRSVLLKADAALRMRARRFARLGVVKTKHYYKR